MSVIVTGDKELDRALARMEAKLLRKLLQTAAKKAAVVVREDFRKRAPVDTGTLANSLAIKVRRYRHKADTGKTVTRAGQTYNVKRVVAEDIGAAAIIDRKRFYKQAMKRGKALSKDEKRKEGYFYPAIVELGGRNRTGQRPLTKALYDNEGRIRQAFLEAARTLVATGGK